MSYFPNGSSEHALIAMALKFVSMRASPSGLLQATETALLSLILSLSLKDFSSKRFTKRSSSDLLRNIAQRRSRGADGAPSRFPGVFTKVSYAPSKKARHCSNDDSGVPTSIRMATLPGASCDDPILAEIPAPVTDVPSMI